MLTLYTSPLSANGRKPLAVCRHLGLDPEVRLVNVYRGEGRRPEYLAINPSGRIPTLVDGEHALFESNAIMLYLCEAHGRDRLWSSEPAARAEIASWLFWESAHWQPALTSVLSAFVGHRLLPETLPAPTDPPDWDDPLLAAQLALLEGSLARRPFLAGDALTIADLGVAGMATYLRSAGFPFDAHPAFATWYARIESLEAWQSTRSPLWS
jgi:glutathione S-transferase